MLAVKLILGLMLMCDLVLGQPNGEATKPGQVVQKVSSDKVHNGGRKGPMSGATNTGNVAPIPILIPFPIIPVQGQQGGQVMTPSQGQGQGQASTTTTPVMGQAGAMNAPAGGQAAQAGGNAASAPGGQTKKKKKKVSKSTDKTKSETRKISIRKNLKEHRLLKAKGKEKVNHGGVRTSRDIEEEENERELVLAQLPSVLKVREQLSGRRKVRQVDGERVQSQQVEDILKTLNNTVTPLSSLINSTNLPSSNHSGNNSNLLLDKPSVAVESIPSLLGSLLGKTLSGRPSVMFIEKVNGKAGGDLVPIPSIKSTLQQSSTLPINNNNNGGTSDAGSTTNNSTNKPANDMEHPANTTDDSSANFYKEVPIINITDSQASLIPSSERTDLTTYLKNYNYSPEAHEDNSSSSGNVYSPLVTTLDKQTNLPLPQGSDLESYLKNMYLVNVSAQPVVAVENTTREIPTTTLTNVTSAVDATLNQNGVIPLQERENITTYLQSSPEVTANLVNATEPSEPAPQVSKAIPVNATLSQDSIIPTAERKAIDNYLMNLTEAPLTNTSVDNVDAGASIMNSIAPTIINVTSTLTENSTISTEDRTNVATFLKNRPNFNTTSEMVGSDADIPIDYRNINASVFRTKETVNETLNTTVRENRTTSGFNNMTNDETPEQAGTRSLLNAFLITAAMKESNTQSSQKAETAAHAPAHEAVESLPQTVDSGSKLTNDKTEKKVDTLTSSTNPGQGNNASTSMDTDYTGSRSDMVNTTNEENNSSNTSNSLPPASNSTLSVGSTVNATDEGHQGSPPAYLTLMAKKYNASIVYATNASEVLPSSTKSLVEGNNSLSNDTGPESGRPDNRHDVKILSNDATLANSTDNQRNSAGAVQLANADYSTANGVALINGSSLINKSLSAPTSLLTDAGFSFIVGTNTSSASSPSNSSVEKSNSTIDIENSTPVRKKPVTNSLVAENSTLVKTEVDMGESSLADNSTGFRSSLTNISANNNDSALLTKNATLVNSSIIVNKTSVTENATKSDELGEGEGTLTNVVTLISNLTQVNASEYLANLTETGIASIAKLIGSLNGLTMGLVEAANASLLEEEKESHYNNSLLSAGDLNHTILERITNEWNYNDSLLVKLVEYFQAMNLTENPELWGISMNDSLSRRVQNYIDAMTSSNASTVQSLEETTELLDSAKKVPVIKSLLEKGRTTLEKQLGTPIDNRQVATIVNKFINWRDQSFSHKCLKDILNVREVNECFSNIAECRETNETQRRNVISNLRNFFTCRDRRKLNKNVIVVGNYTMRQQRHHDQHLRTTINGTKDKNDGTEKKKKHQNEKGDEKIKSLAELLNTSVNRKDDNDEGEGEVKGALQEALAEDDCGDSIASLEKCELKRIEDVANLTREEIKEEKEGASVVHDIMWPAAAEHAAALPHDKGKETTGAKTKLTTSGESKKNKTKEEICEDGSDCFKMQFSKFIEEKCKQYDDAYGKCKMKHKHKNIKEESSESRSDTNTNDTKVLCTQEHKDLADCHNDTVRLKKEFQVAQCEPKSRSGLPDDELPERCFIMNHLEATTFSGHIEKADIVKGEKTVDGARNETTYNATTDFFPRNDSYTMTNQTTYRMCEGCLNNNQNNNDTQNFLSFNQEMTEPNTTVTVRNKVGSENETIPLLNTTNSADGQNASMQLLNKTSGGEDNHNGEGTSLKKFEISKSPLECSDPSLLLMLTSQDDDDRETARLECHGSVKKRELISKHITTHNKKTAADGTVTKDKTSDSTKLTDQDTGKEVKPSSAQSPDEHRKIEDSGRVNTNEHAENHKVLDDILSGKYLDEVKEGFDQRRPESSENRTMRIDPSMLSEKDPRHDHDPENPDADVGIVGREPVVENDDANKTNKNDAEKEKSAKTEDKKKEEDKEKEPNDGKEEKKKGKDEYWLHGVNGDTTTNTKTDKEEDKRKDGDKSTKNDKDEDKIKDVDKNAKKILCFGDSLTKGYYRHGRAYHPYSIKLESLLKEDGINAKVINHGVNGECVALEMQRRLARDLEQLPDLALVIILGGTNDLLNLDCVRKLDLFQEIKNLHMLVRAKGYKSVIMTIPEAKAARLGTDTMSLIEYRKELDTTNQRLRMYAVATRLPIIDLADLFTRHSVDGKPIDAASMWDDDIHPSREGYDRIGEIVYEKVKHLLS